MYVCWILALAACANVSVLAQKSSSAIQTLPNLPENVLATDYSGLQLSTLIDQSDMYDVCRWNYGSMPPIEIFTPAIQCQNRSEITGQNFVLTCVRINNQITTSLVVQFPIQSSVNVTVECIVSFGEPYQEIASININVSDCSSVIPPLVVNSPSATYNSSGTFSCENDGTLFYSNASQLTSAQTTCLATAEWSGENGLECWKAPTNVQLLGEITVFERSNLSLSCSYEEEHPSGSTSIYYVGNNQTEFPKGQSFTIPNLKRSDNNKPLSCQALTPFTQIFPETGRSDERFIKVLYEPYQEDTTSCTWFVNQLQYCKISYYANTNTSILNITKNGALVNAIATTAPSSSQDQVTFYFEKQTSFDDDGKYEVCLSSVVPPYVYTIYFDIVIYQSEIISCSHEEYIIGIIVVAAYAVVTSVIAVAIYCKLSSKLSKTEKTKDEHVYVEATEVNVNAPLPGDRTYLELDSNFSLPGESGETSGNVAPNEGYTRMSNLSTNADYVNYSVTDSGNNGDEKVSPHCKPPGDYDDVIPSRNPVFQKNSSLPTS